jgi:hypothetical protein
MESIGTGAACGADMALKPWRPEALLDLSSTKESQLPQSGHFPIHLAV